MTEATQIFVRLLDEGVDVWRPVQAEPRGEGRYLILDQEVDFGSEHWEFAPGSEVRCTLIELSGQTVLAAIAPN